MKKSIFCSLFFMPLLGIAQTQLDDPCVDLLALLNRPTVADSVCVVKPGEKVIEMGLQYQDLYPIDGHGINLPDGQVRFGLPGLNEFTILPPNYIHQYGTPEGSPSGFTAPVAGLKHQFPPLGAWIFAVEGLFTLPIGSDDFGSEGLGFAGNGIVNYNLTPAFSVALMLGFSTETASSNQGGERFNSVNPDLVFAWECFENLQLYAEFYGQTKTGPQIGEGYSADAGIQYLVTPNIELDIEYGQRLSGELGGFTRYFGIGSGIRF